MIPIYIELIKTVVLLDIETMFMSHRKHVSHRLFVCFDKLNFFDKLPLSLLIERQTKCRSAVQVEYKNVHI